MKNCPRCAEQVQDAAAVCRHCGYKFSIFDRGATSLSNMGCTTMIVLAIGVGFLISRCDRVSSPTPPSKMTAANAYVARIVAEERAVRARLRDPDSAVFQHAGNGCGFVNAKNGFGGMSGFEGYIVKDGVAALQTDHPTAFRKAWRQACGQSTNLAS